MSLPSYFPNPQKTQQLIDDLLTRVKKLDMAAKKRLEFLLETEADLPMLDDLERNYREKVMGRLDKITDRKSAVTLSNALRSHFNKNLNLQRQYLHECVRKVLQETISESENPSGHLADTDTEPGDLGQE